MFCIFLVSICPVLVITFFALGLPDILFIVKLETVKAESKENEVNEIHTDFVNDDTYPIEVPV